MILKNYMIQVNKSFEYTHKQAIIKAFSDLFEGIFLSIIGVIVMVPCIHPMEQALPLNGLQNKSFFSVGLIVLPSCHMRGAVSDRGEDFDRLEIVVRRLNPSLIELILKSFAAYYVSKHDSKDLIKMKSEFERWLVAIKGDPTFQQDSFFDLFWVMWALKTPELIITSVIEIQSDPIVPLLNYDALITRGWSEECIDFYIAKLLTNEEHKATIKALKDEISQYSTYMAHGGNPLKQLVNSTVDGVGYVGYGLYKGAKWLFTKYSEEVPPLERCFHVRTQDSQGYVFLREHILAAALILNPGTEAAPYQPGLSLHDIVPLLRALREYHALRMLGKNLADQHAYFLSKHPNIFRYLLKAQGGSSQRDFLDIFNLEGIRDLAEEINLSTAEIDHLLNVQSQMNAENIMQLIARQKPKLSDKSLRAVASFFATPWGLRVRRNQSRASGFFE